MILVTIAVLMADTTPLTSTDTVTAVVVGEHKTWIMAILLNYYVHHNSCCMSPQLTT